MQLSSSMTTMPPEPMMEPSCAEGLVVHRGVEHLVRDAAAGRAAGLDGFDGAAVGAAAADVVDERLERRAERHLDQAGVLDLADQREDLGARRSWRCRFR